MTHLKPLKLVDLFKVSKGRSIVVLEKLFPVATINLICLVIIYGLVLAVDNSIVKDQFQNVQ